MGRNDIQRGEREEQARNGRQRGRLTRVGDGAGIEDADSHRAALHAKHTSRQNVETRVQMQGHSSAAGNGGSVKRGVRIERGPVRALMSVIQQGGNKHGQKGNRDRQATGNRTSAIGSQKNFTKLVGLVVGACPHPIAESDSARVSSSNRQRSRTHLRTENVRNWQRKQDQKKEHNQSMCVNEATHTQRQRTNQVRQPRKGVFVLQANAPPAEAGACHTKDNSQLTRVSTRQPVATRTRQDRRNARKGEHTQGDTLCTQARQGKVTPQTGGRSQGK